MVKKISDKVCTIQHFIGNIMNSIVRVSAERHWYLNLDSVLNHALDHNYGFLIVPIVITGTSENFVQGTL